MNEVSKTIDGDRRHETSIDAIAVSRGTAVGKAVCLHGNKRQFFKTHIESEHLPAEVERLRGAVELSRRQLEELIASTDHSVASATSIFDIQIMILDHSTLIGDAESLIRSRRVNAEWAIKEVAELYTARQSMVADPLIREKSVDIQDITDRILAALSGSIDAAPELGEDSIVFASVIKPSTLIELSRHRPRAIVTEHGGWTSHAFIMARELNIPAITGISAVMSLISDGVDVAVDGVNGRLVINPDRETIANLGRNPAIDRQLSIVQGNDPAVIKTLDGCEIVIRANNEKAEAVDAIKAAGAKGIGLLRSEFLFPPFAGSFPSEDEQAAAYETVVKAIGDDGVHIRTFDLGSDQISFNAANRESNPALGLRAIRFSLANESQFRIQLRAILRASAVGNASIVLPMVSGVDEIERSRAMIAEETASLRRDGIEIPDPRIGAMIEVPSAVMTIGDIARLVDFVCVGTNDLVQYLLGVDRDNEAVAEYYQTLHPAVVSSISMVVKAADAAGIPAVMCGEMAGSAFYTPLLIGLGARDFSMNLNSIRAVGDVITSISLVDADAMARATLELSTAGEIERLLRDQYAKLWPHLFTRQILNVAAAESK